MLRRLSSVPQVFSVFATHTHTHVRLDSRVGFSKTRPQLRLHRRIQVIRLASCRGCTTDLPRCVRLQSTPLPLLRLISDQSTVNDSFLLTLIARKPPELHRFPCNCSVFSCRGLHAPCPNTEGRASSSPDHAPEGASFQRHPASD